MGRPLNCLGGGIGREVWKLIGEHEPEFSMQADPKQSGAQCKGKPLVHNVTITEFRPGRSQFGEFAPYELTG